ncbi:MAG: carbon-nitrogen hydrolase family protein [Desulfobulbaceae bacterium]|nr:carbon-nitrogen hydrolase family protein [Desulfobulbaceae bacterium]
MNSLHLAFIHAAVRHGEAAYNRDLLLEQVDLAGKAGAKIVIAPELALSGYAFGSREEMFPLAETVTGPTFQALAPLCLEHGLFCCFGFAEQDQASGLLFNSAAVIDPEGRLVLCYRKINAESRWATPGNPYADNTFATPWGRVGVLICSDSYHALMPRITALRGADLLLIPANWPLLCLQTGIDPLDIWRARALENGCHVAACNRGGMDKSMDCRNAVSALIDPQGCLIRSVTGEYTRQLHAPIVLDSRQRLPSQDRMHRLASRKPQAALDCALHLGGINNWSNFHQLPPAGALTLHFHGRVHVAPNQSGAPEGADAAASSVAQLHFFAVQEQDQAGTAAMDAMHGNIHAGQTMTMLCSGIGGLGAACVQIYDGQQEREPYLFLMDESQPPGSPLVVHCGPARIAVLPPAALYHPEHILACAKQGCDLVVIFVADLNEKVRLLAGVRTIEQVAMVLCAPDGASLWLPPQGHERWQELSISREGQGDTVLLDTRLTRSKRFQDLIDYLALLRNSYFLP